MDGRPLIISEAKMPKYGRIGNEMNTIVDPGSGDALVSWRGREYLVSYGERGSRVPSEAERRKLMAAIRNGTTVSTYSGPPPFKHLRARLKPLAWKAATLELVVDCLNVKSLPAYRRRAASVADVALNEWDVFPVVLARLTARLSPGDIGPRSAEYVPEKGPLRDLLVELRQRLCA